MRLTVYLFFLCLAPLPGFAQSDSTEHRVELYGTLSYSYSSESWTVSSYGRTDDYSRNEHIVTVRPGAGYFVSKQWQILFEPQYSLDYSGDNFPLPESDYPFSQWTHGIGFQVGTSFNHWASDMVILFLAAKVGFGWTNAGADPAFIYGSPVRGTWSKPAISLPVISGGTKLFFHENWAVIIQAEYSYTTNYDYDRARSAIQLGIGLSAFL